MPLLHRRTTKPLRREARRPDTLRSRSPRWSRRSAGATGRFAARAGKLAGKAGAGEVLRSRGPGIGHEGSMLIAAVAWAAGVRRGRRLASRPTTAGNRAQPAAALAEPGGERARSGVLAMPDTGFSHVGVLLDWTKQSGDRVEAGELLGTVEVDIAEFDLFAPQSGTLVKLAEPGQSVTVGQPLARVEPAPLAARRCCRSARIDAMTSSLERERHL